MAASTGRSAAFSRSSTSRASAAASAGLSPEAPVASENSSVSGTPPAGERRYASRATSSSGSATARRTAIA